MNTTELDHSQVPRESDSIFLSALEVREIRRRLHELASVMTGIMIVGGLMTRVNEPGAHQNYAADICESSERGAALVREIRHQLAVACGEQEATPQADQ